MTIKELDDKLNSPGFQDTENGDLFYNFSPFHYARCICKYLLALHVCLMEHLFFDYHNMKFLYQQGIKQSFLY